MSLKQGTCTTKIQLYFANKKIKLTDIFLIGKGHKEGSGCFLMFNLILKMEKLRVQ